jgi:hypothetical protein
MSRRLCVALSALALLSATSVSGAFKKPYYSNTKPGSWALYQTSDGTQYRYTRLNDSDGQARVQMRIDFSDTKYKESPPTTNQYTMDKGFSFDRNGISFGRFASELLMQLEGTDPIPLEGEGLENVKKFSIDFDSIVTFVGSETVEGRKTDRYRYVSPKMPDGETESGDIWVSADVPFGLVQQSAVRKDAANNVKLKYTMVLKKSGSEGEIPTPMVAPKPAE